MQFCQGVENIALLVHVVARTDANVLDHWPRGKVCSGQELWQGCPAAVVEDVLPIQNWSTFTVELLAYPKYFRGGFGAFKAMGGCSWFPDFGHAYNHAASEDLLSYLHRNAEKWWLRHNRGLLHYISPESRSFDQSLRRRMMELCTCPDVVVVVSCRTKLKREVMIRCAALRCDRL